MINYKPLDYFLRLGNLSDHVAARTNYRRVAPGEPLYGMIQANLARGHAVCDSWDHNDSHDGLHAGCSNPACWKHAVVPSYHNWNR